ncbi:nitroreductase [Thalassoporum mexicanum PCC 7367]|uniref:nitroreductase family protein n=1 Tax=Thalassoporum mexicanum TaxID=3457544 RepID=UPI00029F9937|nr:nitroreductase family protein [Pseudanabaena sp. PCC 7367]AFY71372.1 nitroreductase [Pseudanabaena sp. PCC 7367]
MEKPAPADHQLDQLIARRWSPRAFSGQHVEDEKILSLLEAARWSASSFNDQPWNFMVARQADTLAYRNMLDCLVPGNRAWAHVAPVLMLAIARKTFRHNDQPNSVALYDTGAAAATLTLQALSMGLFVHQMAGFDAEKAIETFKLPDHVQPMAMIAIGYPGDPSNLPEDLRAKEVEARTKQSRLPLADFVFKDEWGNPAPFL